MTLLELIKSQKYNEQKYNFVIYVQDCDVINTSIKMTFRELLFIIGLNLENKKIVYTIFSELVMIEIKDS